MVVLRKGQDRCQHYRCMLEEPSFEVDSGHGSIVFLGPAHTFEELKESLVPRRTVGAES